jgi:hypothetical protein
VDPMEAEEGEGDLILVPNRQSSRPLMPAGLSRLTPADQGLR